MFLNIHSIIQGSRVNGPGNRFVMWLQGCSHDCPNCYNKKISKKKGGTQTDIEPLVEHILELNLDGITISGGEPFDQPLGLLNFLKKINKHIDKFKHGIIVFTGYEIKEIEKNKSMAACLPYIDLIIEGKFIEKLRIFKCLAGSKNQQFIFNKSTGRGKDLIPTVQLDEEIEVHMDEKDNLIITGFPDLKQSELLKYGVRLKN